MIPIKDNGRHACVPREQLVNLLPEEYQITRVNWLWQSRAPVISDLVKEAC